MHFKLNLTLFIIISTSSRASRHVRSIMNTKRLQSEPIMVQPKLEPEIPEHCRNHSFCEDVPNYPYEYIDYLLENNETVKKALFLLKKRFGRAAGCEKDNDPASVEICKSEMKHVKAKAAQSSNGTWYFLVDREGFCDEKCTSEQADNKCNGSITVNNGYISICKQKRINIPVLAVLDKDHRIEVIHSFLDAGCWCQVRKERNKIFTY